MKQILKCGSQDIKTGELRFLRAMSAYSSDNYLNIILNLFVYLSSNSSQKIKPKGLSFPGFDGGHSVVVTRKFVEVRIKTLQVGYFFKNFPYLGHNSMPE